LLPLRLRTLRAPRWQDLVEPLLVELLARLRLLLWQRLTVGSDDHGIGRLSREWIAVLIDQRLERDLVGVYVFVRS
jgi:hypothetical protein